MTSSPVSGLEQGRLNGIINKIETAGLVVNSTILNSTSFVDRTGPWTCRLAPDPGYACTNKLTFITSLADRFWTVPKYDVERAIALLHESYHLLGLGEHQAYAYTWLSKESLGWTSKFYGPAPGGPTTVWSDVANDTLFYAPEVCGPGSAAAGTCK